MRVDMRPMWHSDSSGRSSTRLPPAGGSGARRSGRRTRGIDAVRTRIATLVFVICAAAWVSAGVELPRAADSSSSP